MENLFEEETMKEFEAILAAKILSFRKQKLTLAIRTQVDFMERKSSAYRISWKAGEQALEITVRSRPK